MLQLQSISFYQFRNYTKKTFSFNKSIVAISGLNGIGKTNLLDAIYYLSFTKTYFARTENSNVQHGMHGFRVEGEFLLNDVKENITCIVRENNKKEVLKNNEPYKKFSDHIGKFPCVIVTPDDIELINGGGDERRKFINTILCQINYSYLEALTQYNKLLIQRNSLLKTISEQGFQQEDVLQYLNAKVIEKGEYIFTERKLLTAQLFPIVHHFYNFIASEKQDIILRYKSILHEINMSALLTQNQSKDILLQRTSNGIHRDDIEFLFPDIPFKTTASQGQKKSLLFALKLAECHILKQYKGFSPILLLDDIFEKLDEQRIAQLLELVCSENKSHIFITDTHQKRLTNLLDNNKLSYQLIEL